MTVQPRLCRMCRLGWAITPLCRQLKLNLEPALQAMLVRQVGCPSLSGTPPRSRLMATFRHPQTWFTYLELCPVRQLPIAMMRMFPLVTVPRQLVNAEMRAPFLLAPTLVTRFLRSVTVLTSRMLKRCTFTACPEVLCMAVKVLGSTLLSDLLPVQCLWNPLARLWSLLLATPLNRGLRLPTRLMTPQQCPRLPLDLKDSSPDTNFTRPLPPVTVYVA